MVVAKFTCVSGSYAIQLNLSSPHVRAHAPARCLLSCTACATTPQVATATPTMAASRVSSVLRCAMHWTSFRTCAGVIDTEELLVTQRSAHAGFGARMRLGRVVEHVARLTFRHGRQHCAFDVLFRCAGAVHPTWCWSAAIWISPRSLHTQLERLNRNVVLLYALAAASVPYQAFVDGFCHHGSSEARSSQVRCLLQKVPTSIRHGRHTYLVALQSPSRPSAELTYVNK
jgi:hypothetical protein